VEEVEVAEEVEVNEGAGVPEYAFCFMEEH
jgi:hypothetical protein